MQMDRETLMMVAMIVCVAGLLFMFRELNKTKEEMDGFKNFSVQLMQQLSSPPRIQQETEMVDDAEISESVVEKKEE